MSKRYKEIIILVSLIIVLFLVIKLKDKDEAEIKQSQNVMQEPKEIIRDSEENDLLDSVEIQGELYDETQVFYNGLEVAYNFLEGSEVDKIKGYIKENILESAEKEVRIINFIQKNDSEIEFMIIANKGTYLVNVKYDDNKITEIIIK